MKIIAIGMCLLGLAGSACLAEVGIGISGAYSVGADVYYGDRYGAEFDPPPVFLGALFRWKPSLFQLDAGAVFWPSGDLTQAYLDGGVCFSPGPFRIGLLGGVDAMILTLPGWDSLWAMGANIRVDLDVRLGRVSIGMSGTLPVDVLLSVLGEEAGVWDVRTEMRISSCLVSVNLIYWLGETRQRSKLR